MEEDLADLLSRFPRLTYERLARDVGTTVQVLRSITRRVQNRRHRAPDRKIAC